MGYPDVKLSGANVLASGPAPWRLIPGVRAPIQEFDVMPGDADGILSGEAVPFTLTFDTGPTTTIKNVVAISRGVGKDPNLARVRVTDQRYGWPFFHLGPRRYNTRRKIGVKLLENPQSVREVSQFVDSIAYHPASLNGGTAKWTALAVLRDMLDALGKAQRARPGGAVFGSGADKATIDLPGIEQLPLENFAVDDSADNALARILGYLPGAQITVDADGTVRVYSEIDGSEAQLVKDSGDESVGTHVEKIDNARIRPREIHVLFEREMECRFDFEESGYAAGVDTRSMENVVQVPDYSLTLPSGAVVTSGTWVEISTAISAWNTNGPLPGFTLSLDFLRRSMVPYMDPWKGVGLAGADVADADWVARIAACLTHYRQTYRINPRWMDRIRSLGAYRVGTVDSVTGTRGKAVCWADYSWIGTQRASRIASRGGNLAPYAMNVARYPRDGLISSTTPPAVADVEVLDADQGIVRFSFRGDIMRVYEQVLPSQIAAVGDAVSPGTQAPHPGPLQCIAGFGSAPFTFDSVRAGGPANALTTQYKAATILTAFPAYPNSEAQLHRVVVKPNDVAAALPEAFRGQLKDCRGPALEIKIGADIETARVAWLDEASAVIEQAFGISNPVDDITGALEAITLNSRPQQAIGNAAASLQAISHAAAAAAWASYANYHQGSKEVPMNGNLKLHGFAAAIEHVVEPDGRAVTKIELRGPRVGLSMFAYLDRNTRALVMRLART